MKRPSAWPDEAVHSSAPATTAPHRKSRFFEMLRDDFWQYNQIDTSHLSLFALLDRQLGIACRIRLAIETKPLEGCLVRIVDHFASPTGILSAARLFDLVLIVAMRLPALGRSCARWIGRAVETEPDVRCLLVVRVDGEPCSSFWPMGLVTTRWRLLLRSRSRGLGLRRRTDARRCRSLRLLRLLRLRRGWLGS